MRSQPPSSASDTSRTPGDGEDRDATEDEAVRGEKGSETETSLLLLPEATEAASARTHIDTILEWGWEAGGNLNLPKLVV